MKNKNIEDVYSLAPVQKGILFHTLYQPAAGAYIQQWHCTLEGALHQVAFQQSWQQVVDHHPVLRSAFVWEGFKEPLQIVQRHVILPWQVLDWRGLSPAEQAHRLDAYLTEDRRQGFAVVRAPLLRCALIHLDERRHYFVWSCHHLVLDGWSTGIVLQEALTRYRARQQGQPPIPQCARPYRDYIAWFQQQDTSASAAFWQRELADFAAPTPLTVDRQQPVSGVQAEEATAPFASQQQRLPHATVADLQALTQRYQLTLNTICQGAWALLLSRYSGEQQVVFGAVTAGRPTELSNVEEMVGVFINTVPVVVTVEPTATVAAWLQRLMAAQTAREPHQFAALVDIRSWCKLPGNTELFESLFVYENYPLDLEQVTDLGPELTLRPGESREQTHYPLELELFPGAELHLKVTYDTARFDAATIERLLGHYCTLLAGMVAAPEAPVTDLPLLTPTEEHQLLTTWNQTAATYPTEQNIHQRFEDQVARTPDAMAVVYFGEEERGASSEWRVARPGSSRESGTPATRYPPPATRLTYRELNARANRLARQLMAHGVGPDTIVALLAERNPDFLTAILAIFKAGGAYMPLDPNHPRARIQQILQQSQAGLLLVGQAFTELAAVEDDGPHLLVLEEVLAMPGDESNLPPRSTPASLAYVLFTSGSTGLPKGVMIEQKGKLNHLYAMIDELALTDRDIIVQNAAQTFDVSVWQFLTALLVGGQVHIYADAVARDPRRLLALVEEAGVTVLEVVPSLLRSMLAEMQPGAQPLASLRWLIPTGEALPPALAAQWFAHYPQIPLINAYGPAECADDVTLYRLDAAPASDVVNMPIGRPIANMRCYVLDQQQRPVPIGIPGELYIAGVGVGRGYLHDPERTQQAFLPSLLPQEDRLYKTGDLVRYLSNGNLEFLGRVDHQVKVRGFRIELGEIEAVLTQHPAVRDCVVVVREEQTDNKLLVAYVVMDQTAAVGSGDDRVARIRTFLRQRLPDYMVPAAIVPLDSLPLTPNGKVNRQALPTPAFVSQGTELTAPRTSVEESLVTIWRDVLGLDAVGIHDSFFDLGGHSLNATQVTARIRETLAIDLPLQTLFAAPTVAELTQQIDLVAHAHALLPQAITTGAGPTSVMTADTEFEEEEW
ncbi:MAG: amino acid adenylation domain-containing protein [Caldilineaceae bacterium]